MSGSSASGSGTRSSRWKVPPEASARSAVIAATMLPAAPVTTNVVSALSARAGSGSTACSTRPTVHRRPSEYPISTAPGSDSVSRDQRLGERGGLAARLEVDRLDQQLLALAGQRLGEARDGSAHRRRRSGRVVAVAATEARRRDQEGARAGNLVGERPHRRREQLHPHAQPLAPGGGIERLQRPLVVEGGQPVDAVDRSLGRPLDEPALRAPRRRAAPSISSTSTPQLLESLRQRRADAAAIGHQDHAADPRRARRPSPRSGRGAGAGPAPGRASGTPRPRRRGSPGSSLGAGPARAPAPPRRPGRARLTKATTWLRVG